MQFNRVKKMQFTYEIFADIIKAWRSVSKNKHLKARALASANVLFVLLAKGTSRKYFLVRALRLPAAF